jgi:hypothetical protein
MDINSIFSIFAALVGFPALIAAGVNVAKYFKLVGDTQAPKVVFWANIVLFVGVAVAFFTGNLPLLNQLDTQMGNIAAFMLTFVAFITDLGLAKAYHTGLRGTPVIGKSYSQEYELEY